MPELVAEGPAPAAARSSSRFTCAPAPGWHGYWLNPGDAGLPMDVKWQLPAGFVGRAAALSGADAADRRRGS